MHQVIVFLSFFLGVEKWRILFLFIHFAKLHDRLKIYHIGPPNVVAHGGRRGPRR
jgi:hypothetical protein